jgi:hypothetical protein
MGNPYRLPASESLTPELPAVFSKKLVEARVYQSGLHLDWRNGEHEVLPSRHVSQRRILGFDPKRPPPAGLSKAWPTMPLGAGLVLSQLESTNCPSERSEESQRNNEIPRRRLGITSFSN